MKSNFTRNLARLALVSLVAFGVIGVQVVAQAQDTACFGLAAADCQLLDAASKTPASALSSFNLDYNIAFNVTGAPDGDTAFTLTGTGPFDSNGADFSAMAANPSAMTSPAAMDQLTAVLGKIIFGTTLDLSSTSKGNTTKVHAELRIINNTLYINEANLTQGKWQSLDLKMMAGMFAGMAGQAPTAPGASTTGSNPADMMAQYQSLMNIPGAITATRGPDVTAGSDQLAAFVFNIDLQKIFASPDFVTLVKAGQAKDTTATPMSDAQLQDMVTKLQAATKDLKVSFTRYVGASDKLPHGGSIDITGAADFSGLKDLAPASSAAGGMGASAESSLPSGPVNLDIHLKAALSAIGQKSTLTAPADATPLDLSKALGGGSTPQ